MTEQEILNGGKQVTVTYRNGQDGVVILRLIKISEIDAYLNVAADELQSLKMCVSNDGFNVDDLTDDSYEALVEANTDLNFTRAVCMVERKLKRAETSTATLAALAKQLASLLQRFLPAFAAPQATGLKT